MFLTPGNALIAFLVEPLFGVVFACLWYNEKMNKKDKIIVYIDGFNLYFQIKKNPELKWLNLVELSKIISPNKYKGNQKIIKVKYFTAKTNDRYKTGTVKKQDKYLEALKTLPEIEIFFGEFRNKKVKISVTKEVKILGIVPEEKGTDVNIGVEMVKDAYEDNFDIAYLVSNDSDLCGAVEIVEKLENKKVVIFSPAKIISYKLKGFATYSQKIRYNQYKNSQFPSIVEREDKNDLKKPDNWK